MSAYSSVVIARGRAEGNYPSRAVKRRGTSTEPRHVTESTPFGATDVNFATMTTMNFQEVSIDLRFVQELSAAFRSTPAMEHSSLTARQLFEALRAAPSRRPFGFGKRPALVNVDVQHAYTRPDEFRTAYGTNPDQVAHIDRLAAAFRAAGLPVVWTYVAYSASGDDCGVWGTRSDGPDALQSIKEGSRRSALDDRLSLDHERDTIINKRMASAFHETILPSLLRFRDVDTIIVTGGSTSGCVRATAVDGLSHGFRVIVPEETTADRHESPHFASLYDIAVKYADVVPVAAVFDHLAGRIA
jgi:maleamate amidohydrolase